MQTAGFSTSDPSTVAPTKRRRWPVFVFGGLGLIIGLLIIGRVFLSTPQAARIVSEKLSNSLGAPVHIKSISAGVDSSTVHEIEIEEAGAANGGKPFATAKEVESNTSVFGLVAGETPTLLTLRGAAVTLRFNSDGKLLTQLPKSDKKDGAKMPTLHLEKGRIALAQEGRPESVFEGIDADFKQQDGKLLLNGSMVDANWGHWEMSADFDTGKESGQANAKTIGTTRLSPTVAKHIPFLPESVLDEVSITGQTTADIHVDFRTHDNFMHYLVKAQPSEVEVFVASANLKTTITSGAVKIEDSVVTLSGAHGQTADGTLKIDGTLDFSKHPNVFKLKVDADRLLVKDLPAEWQIEKKVPVHDIGTGRLSGKADLVITKGKQGITTGGSGSATVVVPHFVSGQDLTVDLKLRSTGDRFEFHQDAAQPMSLKTRKPISDDSFAAEAIRDLAAFMILAQAPDTEPKKVEPKTKTDAKAAGPSYLDLNFSLKNVDLGELVNKLNVKTPFKIGGRITFQVKVSIPTDTASDLKSYRFTGTASLPTFSIEDLTMQDVQAKMVYRDGILQLTDFSGRMPERDPAKPGGSFKGTATLGVVPAGDLTAKLDLDRLPVGQIMGLFPELAKGADGNFTGNFTFNAPSGNLQNPAKWRGSARLASDQAQAVGLTMKTLKLDAKLADGVLALSNLSGNVEGAAITAKGDLNLTGKYPFKGQVDLGKIDLASLNKLAPTLKLPVKLAGSFQADAVVTGDLKPLTYQVNGTGAASSLRVEDFPIDKLDFHWDVNTERFKVFDITSTLFGGAIGGGAEIPLRNDVAGAIDLTLKGVDLAELSKQAPSASGLNFEGKAEGSLKATIPVAKGNEPRQATATVDVQAPKLKVRNIPAEKLHATANYNAGVLAYKLEAAALGGTIELDGRYPPDKNPPKEPAADKPPQGKLSIHGIQLAKLWPAFGASDILGKLEGEASLDLPYSFNDEGKPIGVGTFRLERVRYGDREITPRISSKARLNGEELRFENIETAFGVGMIRGLVALNLLHFDRSRAILTMRNIPADRLLFAIPQLANKVDANFDIQLRTSLGREIRGAGVISALNGKYFGQRAGAVRIPLEWDLLPSQQRGTLSAHDITGDFAQGRLSGKATYEFFGAVGGRVEGDVQFNNLNLPSLIRTESDLGSLGIGQATGRFVFSGHDVRSVDDLTGRLTATLGRTQLSEIPVLKETLPFLGPSSRVADRRSEVRRCLERRGLAYRAVGARRPESAIICRRFRYDKRTSQLERHSEHGPDDSQSACSTGTGT